ADESRFEEPLLHRAALPDSAATWKIISWCASSVDWPAPVNRSCAKRRENAGSLLSASMKSATDLRLPELFGGKAPVIVRLKSEPAPALPAAAPSSRCSIFIAGSRDWLSASRF